MTALSLFELPVLHWFQTLHNPLCDALSLLLDRLAAHGEIFILLILLMLLYKPTRPAGMVCAAALLLNLLVVNITIKPLVARVRPNDLDAALHLILDAPHDYSFPSGHTSVSFAFAAALRPLGRRPRCAAFAFACLMGLSRLYLGVHYPTDVVCGALLGALCGRAALFLWKKRYSHDMIK